MGFKFLIIIFCQSAFPVLNSKDFLGSQKNILTLAYSKQAKKTP
jgi:hypothetical protein